MNPLILNIDTSLEIAFVSIFEGTRELLTAFNPKEADHASWIHVAIEQLLKDRGLTVGDLHAVAVTIGPGSYTGLRIGLATAKGLCFALGIPLVTVNTLEAMAKSASMEIDALPAEQKDVLICPMIDARRMEVYTALYSSDLQVVSPPAATVLTGELFSTYLERQKILFLGNGTRKFSDICTSQNAIFQSLSLKPRAMAQLTYDNFIGNNFAELAYTEPLYLKEFFSNPPNREQNQ